MGLQSLVAEEAAVDRCRVVVAAAAVAPALLAAEAVAAASLPPLQPLHAAWRGVMPTRCLPFTCRPQGRRTTAALVVTAPSLRAL